MIIEMEHEDYLIITDILEEKNIEYKDKILRGYTDNFTPLDKIQELEENQKKIVRILDKLGE